jgi:phosphatidate phosphatase APP1
MPTLEPRSLKSAPARLPLLLRLLPLLALGVPGAARAEPEVLLAPAVGGPARLTANGRVLKARPSEGHGKVGDNLRQLAASGWARAAVQVRFLDQVAAVQADGEGDFTVAFEAPEGRPFSPGWSALSASVPGAAATAQALVLTPEAPYLLISDLDDTLSVTGVTRTRELVRNTLAEDAASQAAVPGMADFYQCLAAASPGPGFALVSGSPIQYLTRVQRFLALKGFPPMALALRRVGLATLSGYKPPALRRLLGDVPTPVVLVGDSGEHDPEVYRQLASEFPGRVRATYIHRVGPPSPPVRFEGMVAFDEAAEAARDAVQRGLAPAACVAERFPPR